MRHVGSASLKAFPRGCLLTYVVCASNPRGSGENARSGSFFDAREFSAVRMRDALKSPLDFVKGRDATLRPAKAQVSRARVRAVGSRPARARWVRPGDPRCFARAQWVRPGDPRCCARARGGAGRVETPNVKKTSSSWRSRENHADSMRHVFKSSLVTCQVRFT